MSYELVLDDDLGLSKYRNIIFNTFDIKSIKDILFEDGNRYIWGLFIQHSNVRFTINRKSSSSDFKLKWVNILPDIFQINIYLLDDGWFKVEVIDRGIGGIVTTYVCDQEYGLRDFLKSLSVI
jgi:hypothetical protein